MSTDLEKLSEFVVVANRLPVDLETDEDGSKNWKRSPGGLVTALEPILRQRDGAWVGWPGVADEKVDPIVVDGLRLFPVELTSQDLAEYYEGFSNDTLWPLYHDVLVAPTFERSWWHTYVAVNQRFAEETARCAADGATVWVQDYQLQLVPAMLRELRPDLTIGFFLHIPFPPVELFMQLPWRKEIVRGMLGADLIGFHLPGGANNFLFLARKLLGLKTTTAGVGVRSALGHVDFDSRVVKVGAFPISVDSAELERQSKSDSVLRRARELKEELGNPEKILLGVDRLDYTKGIDLRLQALKELLDEDRLDPEKYTMVQLATPSRERVQHYIDLRSVIEEQVGRINGDHSQIGRPVVHYLYQPVDREELIALFVAADRHARDADARRDESGGQGVRGLSWRPRRCSRSQRVHRCRNGITTVISGQPARFGRREEYDPDRGSSGSEGRPSTYGCAASTGHDTRCASVGRVVPDCACPTWTASGRSVPHGA